MMCLHMQIYDTDDSEVCVQLLVMAVEHLDFSQFVSVRAVNLARCRHDTVLTAGRLYRTLREVLVCFLGDYPFFAPFYGGHSYAVRTLQADSTAPIP